MIPLLGLLLLGVSGTLNTSDVSERPTLIEDECERFAYLGCCWVDVFCPSSVNNLPTAFWYPPLESCGSSNCIMETSCECRGKDSIERQYAVRRLDLSHIHSGDSIVLSTRHLGTPDDDEANSQCPANFSLASANLYVYEDEFIPTLPCHNLVAQGFGQVRFDVRQSKIYYLVFSFGIEESSCKRIRVTVFGDKRGGEVGPPIGYICGGVQSPPPVTSINCSGSLTIQDPSVSTRVPDQSFGHSDPDYDHYLANGPTCTGSLGTHHFDAYTLSIRRDNTPIQVRVCPSGGGTTNMLRVFLYRGGWTPSGSDFYCNSYYYAHVQLDGCSDESHIMEASLAAGQWFVVISNYVPDTISSSHSIPYAMTVTFPDLQQGGSAVASLDCDPADFSPIRSTTSIVSWINPEKMERDLDLHFKSGPVSPVLKTLRAIRTSPNPDLKQTGVGACIALVTSWATGQRTGINSTRDTKIAVGMIMSTGDREPPAALDIGYLRNNGPYRGASHLQLLHHGDGTVSPIEWYAQPGSTHYPCLDPDVMRRLEERGVWRVSTQAHPENGMHDYTPNQQAYFLFNSSRVGREAWGGDIAIHENKCGTEVLVPAPFPVPGFRFVLVCSNALFSWVDTPWTPWIWNVIRVDVDSGELDPPIAEIDIPATFNTFSIYRDLQLVHTRPQQEVWLFSRNTAEHQRHVSEIQ